MNTRKALIVALQARIERTEHEIEHFRSDAFESGIGYREAGKRTRACLAEIWRKERLTTLLADIWADGPKADAQYAAVYFLALDTCEPEKVPSFHNWLILKMSDLVP